MQALLSILIAAFAAAAPARAQTGCPELDVKGLSHLTATRASTQVVFFASWCSECVVHMRQTLPPGSILIATFDERLAAEAVIKKLGVTTPCYTDQGIAAAYGVKSVPTTLRLNASGQARP